MPQLPTDIDLDLLAQGEWLLEKLARSQAGVREYMRYVKRLENDLTELRAGIVDAQALTF